VIEGTRTLVKADGTRTTVRTLIPETAEDLKRLQKMEAEGSLVFEPPKAKKPMPPDFDRAKLRAAAERRAAR